ncbi:predicted protein [Chaetomium globosum CBS 148.51]|uniref:Uncharacterized protein n=1 Tax=Chaetomium globosum (strain ATCC 6205 / CBS 148.51 / DSM 1962 / NBRC 6347 / NRRL 1970) TaxID=306901 RepID=Q2H8Y8_CHAGB|nr:uncharacterized protein CHGG_03316 [Chaetomium globosum CBS 148.51]EAQ91381.1 predicted protein [Chaetomium globosum CBS 148.51]
MKTSAVAFLLGLYALPALAQELAPSPTESIGCEPHGDHWHCEGPRPPATTSEPTTTIPPPVITTTSAATDDDDEHTDEAGTASLAPSPTESIGCEPHGDHWHCEGPRPPATETGSGEGEGATETPTPSSLITVATTATTEAGESASATTPTSSAVSTAGAAGGPAFAAVPVLGLAAFAVVGL